LTLRIMPKAPSLPPSERPKIRLIGDKIWGVKPMLGLTNLALLTYVLVIIGMVIGKLVPGFIPGL
jgi:hypothetical protein